MLVLLSLVLVLVATVLLALGLLSDAGVSLICVSIGASALAGLALWAAVRLSRSAVRLEDDELIDVQNRESAGAARAS